MAGRKISQLTSSLSPSLSGETPVVLSGVTYKTSLQSLRTVLVDSGSHTFTGNQTIQGDLVISGSLTAQQYIVSSSITNVVIQNISGSSYFGNDMNDSHHFTGSVYITGGIVTNNAMVRDTLFVPRFTMLGEAVQHPINNPEALHVGTTNSYNIAHFKGDNQYYTQLYLQNINSGSNASSDIVVVADNGTENVHYIDLGINSSTYTGGLVGRENDAYLLNVGKDMYVGAVGGTEHPAELKLFAQNSWENPQITIHETTKVSFNTGSVSDGFEFEFSGSAKFNDTISVTNITGSTDLNIVTTGKNVNIVGSNLFVPNGGILTSYDIFTSGSVTASYFIGDGSRLTNLPTGSGYVDTSIYLTTSSFEQISSSFDQRIIDATNEQDLSYFATTGSNSFNGDQTFNGSINIKGVSEKLVVNDLFDYTSGSIFYLNELTENGTWNIINVPTTDENAVTFTFVIEQGSIPYSGSLYQINDETITVKWADSLIPTGSANKTNVIGLTAFRVNNTWNVLGSLSTFGS